MAEGAADISASSPSNPSAREIAWTAPIVIIEGAYLVRDASRLARIEEVDSSRTRIAVGGGSAYALQLARTLQQAELVEARPRPRWCAAGPGD